jgi:hypothetical protein
MGECILVGLFKAQDQTALLIPAIADWVAVVDEQLRAGFTCLDTIDEGTFG